MTNPTGTDDDPHHGPVTRAVPHPDQLNPRGIVITCAVCGASRDWLLIQVRTLVFVRCRCTHEWQEHDLEAVDFDGSHSGPETEWESFEQMYRSLGFDGLFRGSYLGA
ncbi:hypothetical protein OG500_19310 [Kitasatospora sp. NBC_01250]|uniref:hypothetical protein n=1 Tax=Kitasatospora sp. NBC_01250 TaxID=2903571 RepID=UPI002E325ABB|nr:hypothetical protein [Kitasatospora sp. NBC_01250]